LIALVSGCAQQAADTPVALAPAPIAAPVASPSKTQDETVQTITDEMAGQYPDRARLGGAVRTAYVEAKYGRSCIARTLRSA